MSQRNLLILLAAVVASYACYVRGEQSPYARYVATGLGAIERSALQSPPGEQLFVAAMQGMVGVLRQQGDEHSQFLAQDEADPLRTEIRQQFGGIGVRIRFEGEPPRLTIVGPPDPGSPAARANLLPGDHIRAIDGRPTDEMTMTDVLRRMRGEPGSQIRLLVEHEHVDEPRSVELVRELISIESILGDVRRRDGKWRFRLPMDRRIAHVRITSFGDRTADELRAVFDRLSDEGLAAVVLDLRDNAGGTLDTAVAVCDLFLPAGLIVVETRSRNERLRDRRVTWSGGRYLELPLAVLVNQNSASAAEIVAAAFQDHGRAKVVGQRTYGKGTVQQLLPMEAGRSLLKLTTAGFWRPNGENIHRMPDDPDDGRWGIVPDDGLELALSPEQYAEYRRLRNDRDILGQSLVAAEEDMTGTDNAGTVGGSDPQLDRAVEYLQSLLDERVL